MFARILSGVVVGIDAREIEVQCDVSGGLPTFSIVGLPEKEVSESRERIRSALKNSGFSFPAGRITANLAPADLRKEGVGFDLAIAVAILMATEQITRPQRRLLFVGELALDGAVRGVRGVLPIAMEVGDDVDGLVVSHDNAAEAAVATDVPVYGVRTLHEVCSFLNGAQEIRPTEICINGFSEQAEIIRHDLSEVRGQLQAKRALEIAAAGGHNLLMVGPPGAGKSLLARCLPELLPTFSRDESLEVTRIYSTAGLLEAGDALIPRRPYRAPHHTISYAGMVGGGHGVPGPGEISLAHHGVLFLDELPEFDRKVLETLRQPLEERSILLARAGISVRYPAAFTLVGAMNPCPCGMLGDPEQTCTCSARDLMRYRRRLSGPFLDRIDLFVDVPRLPTDELFEPNACESSQEVRTRVDHARGTQWVRYEAVEGCYANAQLDGEALRIHCALNNEANTLLRKAVARFALSARAYVRILRVARTIADLEGADRVLGKHIAEAVQYRASGLWMHNA